MWAGCPHPRKGPAERPRQIAVAAARPFALAAASFMRDDDPTKRGAGGPTPDPDDQPTVRGLAAGLRMFGRYRLRRLLGRGAAAEADPGCL